MTDEPGNQATGSNESGKGRGAHFRNRPLIKTTQLQLRIDPKIKARLTQAAKARGITMTRLVESGIEKFLADGVDAVESER